MKPAIVQRFTIFPLSIPLRTSVHHTAADRAVADPVLVAVELINGVVGYGEAVARPYVTGETADTVISDIETIFAPLVLDFHPPTFPEALEALEALPYQANGRLITAARGAVEMALLDACLRYFERSVEDIVRWMGLPEFGAPGSTRHIRYSGVLASRTVQSMRQNLRWMYWWEIRNFKIKVGMADDSARLGMVRRYLGKGLSRGRVTVRADANGAWSLATARAWLQELGDYPLAALEQPLPRGAEEQLAVLKQNSVIPLMHDESLITLDDARRLIELGVADFFNIRLSKCGGFLPSLHIAALARKHGVGVQLGCMVGETSVLSAAALRFLEVCPGVQWAEGLNGTYLLREDICRPSLRFRYGGRLPRHGGRGWGVQPDSDRLQALAGREPILIQL